jgi:hypothetical protein
MAGTFPGIDSRIVILVPGECQSLAGGAIKAKEHAAKEMQGQRLGTVLLADALRRAYGNAGTVGSSMVIVDALDEGSADFLRIPWIHSITGFEAPCDFDAFDCGIDLGMSAK